MTEQKAIRLSKIAREFNVGISTIVDFLKRKGYEIDTNPNTKLDPGLYDILVQEYSNDLNVKKESKRLTLETLRERRETISISDLEEPPEEESEELLITDHTTISEEEEEEISVAEPEELEETVKTTGKPSGEDEEETGTEEESVKETGPRVLGKIDLESMNQKTRPKKKTAEEKAREKEEIKAEKEKPAGKETPKTKKESAVPEEKKPDEVTAEKEKKAPAKPEEDNLIPTKVEKLTGPTVVGKIDLPEKREHKKKMVATSADPSVGDRKKKRKRIRKDIEPVDLENGDSSEKGTKKDKFARKKKRSLRPEVNEEDVQRQIKDTLAKLTAKGKSRTSKYRREKRDLVHQKMQ
ncbi:MAG: hypothetical protein JXA39_02500, partial [Bacteroidales bacterium]|nr:hypothetical protein [Bacteroidales bacterium]